MSQSMSRGQAKKVLVQSRYRSLTRRPTTLSTSCVTGKAASSSSPKHQLDRPFLIHDSVASIIHPDADLSTSEPPRRHRSHSFSVTNKNQSNQYDSAFQTKSMLLVWRALNHHARCTLEKLRKQEEALKRTLNKKSERDAWMKRWLEAQKSIDLQINIFERLLEFTNGENGILSLLRRMHDLLLPINMRLPINGILAGDDLPSQARLAREAQEHFVACVAGDVRALSDIARQLEELTTTVNLSTTWLADDVVKTKLYEACQLCLHLASLRAHRLQQEAAKAMGIYS